MQIAVDPRFGFPPMVRHRAPISIDSQFQRRARGMGAASPQVTLQNLSGGTAALFHVGDTVQVTVVGPPNQPVSFSGVLNGVAIPLNSIGMTDANGNFSWSAPVTAALLGVITENWTVGGAPAGTFTFTVAQAPGTATPPAATAASPIPGVPAPVAATTGILDWFVDPTQAIIGGIPNWIVVGGGLIIVLMLTKGRRR